VGFSDNGGNWVPPGVVFLPLPPGCDHLFPWRINDHGEVVAAATRDDRTTAVLVYNNSLSSWIDIGADYDGSFLDFNNHTQVVGGAGYPHRAFRWSPDGTAQGKLELFSSYSWANGINNAGQFVGGAYLGNAYRAFRYTDDEGMKSLGTLGQSSEAWGINDLGQVVGFYSVSTKNKGTVTRRAYGFLHVDAFGMVPLDNLVTGSAEDLAKWHSAGIEPRRINTPRLLDGTPDPNGFGQICGTAHYADGDDAFLLTPEPK
jgi:probable HAF family extracellular repeat protein